MILKMASPFIKLIKMIDTGEFSVLSTFRAHFCFFEASTGKRSPSLEGNLASALPSLVFDWEQLNLFHCLLRPGCVALPAEISDSSSAPFTWARAKWVSLRKRGSLLPSAYKAEEEK